MADPLAGIFGPQADPLKAVFGGDPDFAAASTPLGQTPPKAPTPLADAVNGSPTAPTAQPTDLLKDIFAERPKVVMSRAEKEKADAAAQASAPETADDYVSDKVISAAAALPAGIGSSLSGLGDFLRRSYEVAKAHGIDIPQASAAAQGLNEAGGAVQGYAGTIESAIPADRQQQTGNQLAALFGGMSGLVATAMVGGVVASVPQLLGQGFDQINDALKQKGESGHSTSGLAAEAAGGAAVAVLNTTGLGVLLHGVPLPIQSAILRGLTGIGMRAGADAITFAAQGIATNLAAQLGLDPSKPVDWADAMKGAGKNAAMGAVMGGVFGALGEAPPTADKTIGEPNIDVNQAATDAMSPSAPKPPVPGRSYSVEDAIRELNMSPEEAQAKYGSPNVPPPLKLAQNQDLAAGAPQVTPQDQQSPLPTDLIQQGKGAMTIDLTDPMKDVRPLVEQQLKSTEAALAPVLQTEQPSAETALPPETATNVKPHEELTPEITSQRTLDLAKGLVERGVDSHVADGIAAGIIAESAGNPTAHNKDSGAFGYGQWLGSRRDALFAKYGPNPTPDQQLDFLVSELKGGDPGGKFVLGTSNAADALDAYITKFMRPKAGYETERDLAAGAKTLGLKPGDVAAPAETETASADDQMQPETFTKLNVPEDEQAQSPAPDEWQIFKPESGTLNVPRDDMPQVKSEDHGALVNFLNARDITQTPETVDPTTLKPTQAEFNPAKVETALGIGGNGDRSVLVSNDGYILDGTHQWLADLQKGQPTKVIRLDAPITDLISLTHEFPSSKPTLGTEVAETAAPPRTFDLAPVKAAAAADNVHIDAHEQDGSIFLNYVKRLPGSEPGTGAKAINAVLQQADELGLPVRLRASEAGDSRPQSQLMDYYRQLGFRDVDPGKTSEMVREPQPPAASPQELLKAKIAANNEPVAVPEKPARQQRSTEPRATTARPPDFLAQLGNHLQALTKRNGLRTRISAEDAIDKGVPADEIFIDTKAKHPVVKLRMQKYFATDKGPLNSKAVPTKRISLDGVGDVFSPQDFGVRGDELHGHRIDPEDAADLINRSLARDDSALDRSHARYEPYMEAKQSEEHAAEEQYHRDELNALAEEHGVKVNDSDVSLAMDYVARGVGHAEALQRAVADAAADMFDADAERFGEDKYREIARELYQGDHAEPRGGSDEEALAEPRAEHGRAAGTPENGGQPESGERPVEGPPDDRTQRAVGETGDATAERDQRTGAGRGSGADHEDAGRSVEENPLAPRETDTRDHLQRKANERLIPSKEQKPVGSDGGLFDTRDTTGDLFAKPEPTDPVEKAKAILQQGLDALNGKEAKPGPEPQKTPEERGLKPLFDSEEPTKQVGHFDEKIGKPELTDKLKEAASSGLPLFNRGRGRLNITDEQESQLRNALQTQLDKFGISDRISLEAAKGLKLGKDEFRGQYWNRVISVALDRADDPAATLAHETWHAVGPEGIHLVTSTEYNLVNERGWSDPGIRAHVEQHYPNEPLAVKKEEAGAFWIQTSYALRKTEPLAVRIVYRIDRFFDAVKAAAMKLFGKGGEMTPRQVADALFSGKIGERPEGFGGTVSRRGNPISVTFGRKPMGEAEDDRPVSISDSHPDRLFTPVRAVLDALKDGTSEKVGKSIDNMRTVIQDRMLPVLRTQASIERMLGRKIADEENPYLAEELFHGRTGARLDQLARDHVGPLFAQMRDAKVKPDELDAFLYARHAPERNERIAQINPEFGSDLLGNKGSGSGMSNEDAAAIMDAVDKAGKREIMESLASKVDAMLKQGLDTRVESGLLSPEEAAAWRRTYQHYVPLRGLPGDEETEGARINRASGFTVKGKESRMAFGRRSPAQDILAHAILQSEEAIVRSEQNEVAKALGELAKAAPDPTFWKLDKIRRVPVFNKSTGQVSYRSESRIAADDAPYTVSYKDSGIEHRVTFNRRDDTAVRTAAAMRNLGVQQMNLIVRTVGSINRLLSKMYTSYVPEFIISNGFRDLQSAAFFLPAQDIKGLTKKVALDYPTALVVATKGSFGKESDSEWGRWHREFRMEGGHTAFNDMRNVADLRKEIEQAASLKGPLAPRRMAKAVLHVVENANDGVENALRLATYKNARELGATKKQAASLAKNVTVNFNRKGTMGPLLNTLYLFFNASIQDDARILMLLGKSRKVQGMAASMVALGYAMQMMNTARSEKDKDGDLFYNKINEYDHERNLIIMLDGQHYLKIPMQWGLNTFPNFGRMLARLYQGERPMKALADFTNATLDSFSPVGSGRLVETLAPTIVRPLVDLTENSDYANRPIMPDQKRPGEEVPNSQRYWSSVPPYDKAVTDFLNKASGGDNVRPGAIDVSPEVLHYLSNQVFGGVGTFFANLASIGSKALSDDPSQVIESNEIPFSRRVYGSKPSWYDRAAFIARIQEVQQDVSYAETYLKQGNVEKAREMVGTSDDRQLLQLAAGAQEAQSAMNDLHAARGQLENAQAAGKISDAQFKADKLKLEQQEAQIIDAFNRLYLNDVSKPLRP